MLPWPLAELKAVLSGLMAFVSGWLFLPQLEEERFEQSLLKQQGLYGLVLETSAVENQRSAYSEGDPQVWSRVSQASVKV